MVTRIRSNKTSLFFTSVFITLAVVGTFAASTTGASIVNIAYPIPELENCIDRETCKAYCQEPAHQMACREFAAKYNIGEASKRENEEEVKRVAITRDGGPDGACGYEKNPIEACREYCAEQAHIETCISYGEKHQLFKSKALESAKRVRDALKSGAKLPPGCTDEASCRKVCVNPPSLAVAEQCFKFTERAGLLSEEAKARSQKLLELRREGAVPDFILKGGCEKPVSEEIFKKCTAFGVEHGFISEKEGRALEQTHGVGPGGCKTREECEAFCTNEKNQLLCLKFAEEHNLVPEGEYGRMMQGVENFRRGLERMPEAVRQCIPEELVKRIESGTISPSELQKFGELVKECTEEFREKNLPAKDSIDQKTLPRSTPIFPAKPMPSRPSIQNTPQSLRLNPPNFFGFFADIFTGITR